MYTIILNVAVDDKFYFFERRDRVSVSVTQELIRAAEEHRTFFYYYFFLQHQLLIYNILYLKNEM